jgi:hypothetical protein
MDQVQKGQRSTSTAQPEHLAHNQYHLLATNNEDASPPATTIHADTDPNPMETPQQTLTNEKTHAIFMTIHTVDGHLYSNQTSHMPVTSNRGHAYVVIFYVYDANYVKSIPIKNHSKDKLLRAYNTTYSYLTTRGYKPQLHKMDNESLQEDEDFIAS